MKFAQILRRYDSGVRAQVDDNGGLAEARPDVDTLLMACK